MYIAVVTDSLGNVLKTTGPYADVDEAMRAYNIPGTLHGKALEDRHKFTLSDYRRGPFLSIRPLQIN